MNFPAIACQYYNDYYEEGIAFEKAEPQSSLFKKVKRKMAMGDFEARIGLRTNTSIIAIIFKEMPDNQLMNQLKKTGFTINQLPRNPYTSTPAK